MDRMAVIEKVDLLSLLTPAAREVLANEARERVVTAGEVLCREGETGRTFWVIATGLLAIEVGTPPVEVNRLSSGSYFGEMSLLTGEPRVATVTALIRSELLEFDRPAFLRLFSENAALAPAMSQQIAVRRAGLARVTSLNIRPVRPASSQDLDDTDAGSIFGRIKRLFGLG